MEAEMERLLKEREKAKPMEGITLSVVPISTTMVTVIPPATTVPLSEGATDLAKSMERMNL
jgi:hypothetical protein